jgi:hypothetical protein
MLAPVEQGEHAECSFHIQTQQLIETKKKGKIGCHHTNVLIKFNEVKF